MIIAQCLKPIRKFLTFEQAVQPLAPSCAFTPVFCPVVIDVVNGKHVGVRHTTTLPRTLHYTVRAISTEGFLRYRLTCKWKLRALMAAETSRYPDCAFSGSVVTQDTQAIAPQVAGMTGTRVPRSTGMPLTARAKTAMGVFVAHAFPVAIITAVQIKNTTAEAWTQ